MVNPVFDDFSVFFAELGPCPDGMSIDRKDNNKGYEPGNVRWATKKTQMRNRSDNRFITHRGKTQTLVDWSDEIGISIGTLWYRKEKCRWSIERSLDTKLMTRSQVGIKGANVRWELTHASD